MDLLLVSDENKAILLSSSMIPEKSTRTSQGVQLFNLKKRHTVQYGHRRSGEIHGSPILQEAEDPRHRRADGRV